MSSASLRSMISSTRGSPVHQPPLVPSASSAVMCRRLSDYLCGHRKALSVVHIPSREEEARRAQGRLREQLRLQVQRMRAMGRSLLLQRELVLPGRWWTPAKWQRIQAQMPARPLPAPASPLRLLGLG